MSSDMGENYQDHCDFFNEPAWRCTFPLQDNLQSDNLQISEPLMNDQRSSKEGTQKCHPKLQKQRKIRTSRNVQKIYHNILKSWLEGKELSWILPKYHLYYNQRVYFVLVLEQILKHSDGFEFLKDYGHMANSVILKKMAQAQSFDKQKPNSQQSLHLKRVIEQIEHSVKACREFVEGNWMEATIIVYKRNQTRISKQKQFLRAIEIFKQVTGRSLSNI